MRDDQMPILQPIPIRTLGRPGWQRLQVWIGSTRKFLLVFRWEYDLPDDERLAASLRGQRIAIDPFIFDGASIPKLLRVLLSPVGLLLLAALPHDQVYQNGHLLLANGLTVELTRAEADVLFRVVNLEVNGVRSVAWATYAMVRSFGWAAWRKHRCRQRQAMPSPRRR